LRVHVCLLSISSWSVPCAFCVPVSSAGLRRRRRVVLALLGACLGVLVGGDQRAEGDDQPAMLSRQVGSDVWTVGNVSSAVLSPLGVRGAQTGPKKGRRPPAPLIAVRSTDGGERNGSATWIQGNSRE